MSQDYRWNVYEEQSNGTAPRRYLGQLVALDVEEALHKAAEYYEIDPGDLIVIRSDVDPHDPKPKVQP